MTARLEDVCSECDHIFEMHDDAGCGQYTGQDVYLLVSLPVECECPKFVYQPKHLIKGIWTDTDEQLAIWWADEEERDPVKLKYWPHKPAKHRALNALKKTRM